MHNIVFDYVSKSYGSKEVIKDLNFEIKEGERVIFLGPSGCGKSTTLRMIAGFEDITSGKLSMGGKVINDVAPGLRNIAMVFQSYALFPHMNVWDYFLGKILCHRTLAARRVSIYCYCYFLHNFEQ